MNRLAEGLFLYDLGVLDHGDTATLGELAFHGDIFTAVLSELLVDWLVFANHQIGLPSLTIPTGPPFLMHFAPQD